MAATVVTPGGVSSLGIELNTPDNLRFYLKSFKNDILSIEHYYGSLEETCDFVAGCFKEGSSFYGIKTVKFNFSGVKVCVTEAEATPEAIRDKWLKAYNERKI